MYKNQNTFYVQNLLSLYLFPIKTRKNKSFDLHVHNEDAFRMSDVVEPYRLNFIPIT